MENTGTGVIPDSRHSTTSREREREGGTGLKKGRRSERRSERNEGQREVTRDVGRGGIWRKGGRRRRGREEG